MVVVRITLKTSFSFSNFTPQMFVGPRWCIVRFADHSLTYATAESIAERNGVCMHTFIYIYICYVVFMYTNTSIYTVPVYRCW